MHTNAIFPGSSIFLETTASRISLQYVYNMKLAHGGMGINEADWARFIEIVTKVAGELGVGPTEGGEVMAFLDSLKGDIVEA